MHFLLSIIMLLLFFSCSSSSGYKKEGLPQGVVHEPGAAPSNAMTGIPLFSKKEKKNTRIAGTCLFRENGFDYPVRYKKVFLMSEGKKILETSTDNNGNFIFYSYLENGAYTLAVDSDSYKGERKLKLKGTKYSGIELVVSKID